MEYVLKRTKRKTVAVTVKADGTIEVAAPLFATAEQVEEVLRENEKQIEHLRENFKKKLEKQGETKKRYEGIPKMTEEEKKALKKEALPVFCEEVREAAAAMGVRYGKITARLQKTRWGSCNQKGDLSFNALLLLAPRFVLRQVVVHELCHTRYMNHGKRFHALLQKFCPETKEARKWLKENGDLLLWRIR